MHGSVRTGCSTYPGYADGCVGAANGSIKYTYASLLQSGQVYTSAHPQPWNLAGVDYGVGVPVGQTLKDPTVNANLPGSCTYSSITHQVSCPPGTVSPTFDSLDFSGATGGTGCVELVLAGSRVSGTVTISNSLFKSDTNCDTGAGSAQVVLQSGGSASMVLTNNTFDGNADAYNPIFMANSVAMTSTGGTLLVEYCAFLNTPARAVEPNTTGNVTFQYNFGLNFYGTTAHAEFAITASNGGTMALHTYAFNTFVQGAATYKHVPTTLSAGAGTSLLTFAQVPGGTQAGDTIIDATTPAAIPAGTAVLSATGTTITLNQNIASPGVGSGDSIGISPNVTALISPSEVAASIFTLVDINHNTMIVNQLGGAGGAATASTDLEIAYATYTTINLTQNYFDATGALGTVFARLASAPTIGTTNWSGNVSLVSGAAVTAYGQVGP